MYYPDDMNDLRRILTIALAVMLVGCGQRWGLRNNPSPSPAGETAQKPTDPPDPRDVRIRQLLTQRAVLDAKITELGATNSRLTDRVNELEFLNRQLTGQLKVVGEAPRERDRFKARVLRLELENAQLRERIGQLEGLLGIKPATTTAPASQPAAPVGGSD